MVRFLVLSSTQNESNNFKQRLAGSHRGIGQRMEYRLSLARDLKLIKGNDYEELAQRTNEVKRVLAALIQELGADR